MADPWNSPDADDRGEPPARPFDRQALQATLADALRTVGDGETDAAAGAAPAAPSRPTGEDAPPRNPMARVRLSPPSPGSTPGAPSAGRPAGGLPRGLSGAPAEGPRPLGSITNTFRPPAGGIGGGSLGGGGFGAGAAPSAPARLQPPSPPVSPLSGGEEPTRLGSAPAGAAVEQPTVPLRRRPPVNPAAVTATGEAPPAPAPPVPGTRVMAEIAGWSPADDDIVPGRQARRGRAFRRVR